MHRWLRRDGTADDLLEQTNERSANSYPWAWCERIRMDTASPVDREEVAKREDFTGDLARLCAELRESPEALVSSWGNHRGTLTLVLPIPRRATQEVGRRASRLS